MPLHNPILHTYLRLDNHVERGRGGSGAHGDGAQRTGEVEEGVGHGECGLRGCLKEGQTQSTQSSERQFFLESGERRLIVPFLFVCGNFRAKIR